ncbi:MAG: hypothetical protein IT445_12355 [Phycisphaeraceae bacterium]|nr:hypothetical protein [Phycisphaeraceae bacterium]
MKSDAELINTNVWTAKRVNSLTLSTQLCTDQSIKELAKFLNLRRLRIYSSGITATGFQDLPYFEQLTHIYVPRSAMGNDALKVLVRAAPNLAVIDISYCPIGDLGVQALALLPKLEYLDLSGTDITSLSIETFRNMPNLNFLRVDNTDISQAEVTSLFESLSIQNCRKEDASPTR